MASKIQYDVLRSMYDEELQRCSELRNSAKTLLGVTTFLTGSLILKINDFIVNTSLTGKYFLYGSALFLVFSSVFLLYSLRTYKFEQLCNPRKVIEAFGDNAPNDETFLNDRLVDIAVAFDRNNAQNQKIARLVTLGSISLIMGTALAIIGVLLRDF